jgi:hypothetical protein
MNILKVGKLTLAALLGSLIWAGCASTQVQTADQPALETTVDLTKTGPDTRPQDNVDLYSPYQSGWTIRDIE